MKDVDLRDWIGRSETATDVVRAERVAAISATFDAPIPTGALPELWHWFCFLPIAARSDIATDGHPKRGGFLPPVPLERRMWAAGRLSFHAPMMVGDRIARRSEIKDVAEKEGKTGPMVFVTVKHTVSADGVVCVEEEQDIVYLRAPERFTPPPAKALPEGLDWSDAYPVDTVLLFRFSALTFNGHRIHYDLPYATEVEKYPGLVTHGPLQAMALFEAAKAHAPGRAPARYAFRATHPLFGHQETSLNGKGDALFVANGERTVTMKADIGWKDGE